MKNKLFLAGAIVALLLTAYIFGRCSTKSARDNAINNLIAARDTIHSSTVVINGLTTYVSDQDALILSQKDALAASELEKEALKKLHIKDVVTNSKLTGEVKILRDSIALLPPVVVITLKDTAGIAHDYAKIPFTLLDIEEPDLHLIAGMNVNKTAYFSMRVPFTGTMTVGYKKTGLFKTVPVGVFTSTNPYIHISDMNTVIIQQPKKWYNNFWVHIGIGAGAALVAQHYLK
jgi:hypothetical protein